MDRDALVERMAEAACNRIYPPGCNTWAEFSAERAKAEWRLDMRAALAIAEPAVREDCAAHLDAMAALSSSPHDIDAWTEAAAAIRARKEART